MVWGALMVELVGVRTRRRAPRADCTMGRGSDRGVCGAGLRRPLIVIHEYLSLLRHVCARFLCSAMLVRVLFVRLDSCSCVSFPAMPTTVISYTQVPPLRRPVQVRLARTPTAYCSLTDQWMNFARTSLGILRGRDGRILLDLTSFSRATLASTLMAILRCLRASIIHSPLPSTSSKKQKK